MPKVPVNYSNTIMYKIVCKDLNVKELYVGHTVNFRSRKNKHASDCAYEMSKNYDLKIYKYIRENGGWSNWEMIEIEKYNCNDGNEARARERYWFEELQAKLNMTYPQRNMQEYNKTCKQQNPEKIDVRGRGPLGAWPSSGMSPCVSALLSFFVDVIGRGPLGLRSSSFPL